MGCFLYIKSRCIGFWMFIGKGEIAQLLLKIEGLVIND